MAFLVPKSLTEVEDVKPAYDHGFTEEQVIIVNHAKAALDKRDVSLEPVTLEEFRTVIAPWFIIQRTEQFILHPEKVKVIRVPKEPKVKVPKVKKLTKAQTQAELQRLIMKMAMGTEFTPDEQEFFDRQTGKIV